MEVGDPTAHLRLAHPSRDIFWVVAPSSHQDSVSLSISVPLSRAREVLELQGHHEAKGGGLVARVILQPLKL